MQSLITFGHCHQKNFLLNLILNFFKFGNTNFFKGNICIRTDAEQVMLICKYLVNVRELCMDPDLTQKMTPTSLNIYYWIIHLMVKKNTRKRAERKAVLEPICLLKTNSTPVKFNAEHYTKHYRTEVVFYLHISQTIYYFNKWIIQTFRN